MAKLIREEITEHGFTCYWFECFDCGNEYFKWTNNKRTSCYCPDCYNKRQQALTKIREQRKHQEAINKVLKEIRAEIAKDLENTENDYQEMGEHMDLGITIGLQMALDTIDKHIPNSVDASKAD